jgi:phosphoadenosine phosphosulfate reductase
MSSLAAPDSASAADELANELSDASAAEILQRAAERFPGRTVLTCSWQRTSSVLAHLIASGSFDVRIVEVDTGLLFPETHEVRDRLIERLGISVETLRPRRTVAEQALDQGAELWLRDPDACCGLRKVAPLWRWSSEEVDAYCVEHDLPVHALHAQGYPSIGCIPCTRPVAPGEDERAGRWAGTGKTECGLHRPT